jgi:hypothetical protein
VRDGEPPLLSSFLIGSTVLGERLHPAIARWCAAIERALGIADRRPIEIRLSDVVDVGLMRTGSPFNARFKGRHREEFTWFAIAGSLPILSIDGRRAAAQIVDAARHGDAELIITWPAKLAIAATATVPNTMAWAMEITNRVLPKPTDDPSGNRQHSGWQSVSRWAPSVLTRSSERSAAANNEVPPPAT